MTYHSSLFVSEILAWIDHGHPVGDDPDMGFNKREMEDRRRKAAEKEAAARRALGPQIIEDSVKLIESWDARQASHMPMLFSPTIEAACTAGYWFLRARCPACRTTGDVDLRRLDWHRGAAVTALIPALSCRSCRPNAPFAELVCLSKSSVAEEYYAERSGNRWVWWPKLVKKLLFLNEFAQLPSINYLEYYFYRCQCSYKQKILHRYDWEAGKNTVQ
jgi:hypothetical protein